MPVPYTSHDELLRQVAADRASRQPHEQPGWRVTYTQKGKTTTVLIPFSQVEDQGAAVALLYRRAHVRFEEIIDMREVQ